MFSEELNKLIEASLVDGVLTDKERAVIRKRALLEGVDPDEVDLMLDAEIDKLRIQQESAVKKVKKCPSCGEIIPAMSIKCPTCGYELRNMDANESVEKLFSMINELYASNASDKEKEEKAKLLINNFPVPTTKEDITEFLFMAIPNSQDNLSLFAKIGNALLWVLIVILGLMAIFSLWGIPVLAYAIYYCRKNNISLGFGKNKLAKVWRLKCDQIIMKAKYSMSDDPKLMQKISEYENSKKQSKNVTFIGVAGVVLLIAIYFVFSNYRENNSKDAVDKQYIELCKQLDALETPNALNYTEQTNKLLKIVWDDIDGGGSYQDSKKESYLEKKKAYASQLKQFYEYSECPNEITLPDMYIKK